MTTPLGRTAHANAPATPRDASRNGPCGLEATARSRLTARARFAAALGPGRAGAEVEAHAPTAQSVSKRTIAEPSRARADPEPERGGGKARRLEARREPAERDGSDLVAFRPMPPVLQPPPVPVTPGPVARPDLGRLAEQLVTRLRVGRSREGATIELRLSLGDRELDVRLVETAAGVSLHVEGDDALEDAIARELLARGLPMSA